MSGTDKGKSDEIVAILDRISNMAILGEVRGVLVITLTRDENIGVNHSGMNQMEIYGSAHFAAQNAMMHLLGNIRPGKHL